jgi:ATPase family associated with various cellular activities (AAA)
MDTIHLLQFSIYSKLIQEFTFDKTWLENPIVIFSLILFTLYKIIPSPYIYSAQIFIYDYFQWTRSESSIIIPYHNKTYAVYGGKSITKTHYSERFLAINHYLNTSPQLSNIVEVMNFENSRYDCDSHSEFILVPNNYDKIRICHKDDIWFEVIQEQLDTSDDTQGDDKKRSSQPRIQQKNYTYRLTKKGRHNIHILQSFIENCIKCYKKANEKEEQMIYEYTKYKVDDECDRICMTFQSSPFFSNKSFANIFFEGKEEIHKEIADFSTHSTDEEKEAIIKKYRNLGIAYKKIFLLHGPPGCGKSSLIKAISIETGRHVIFVPWSRMKTCAEFSNLFYELKIGSKILQQKDVIFVFEDFDANQNEAIKTRGIDTYKKSSNTILDKTELEKKKKETNDPFMKQALENLLSFNTFKPACSDELTLECVLNTLDGIKELYNAILIFTTNDIESIDPAVIRPGRVDRIIEMKLASRSVIKDILEHFYRDVDPELISVNQAIRLLPSAIAVSPAKVQEICIQYKNNIVGAVDELNRVFLSTVPYKIPRKML